MKLWELLEDRGDRGNEVQWRRDIMVNSPAAANQKAPAWELQGPDPNSTNWVVEAGNTIILFNKTKEDAQKLAANPAMQQKYAKYGKLRIRYHPV